MGPAEGPDKKGRFFLHLPQSEKRLYFYSGVPGEESIVRRGKKSRRGEQGDLLEIVEPSSFRREAPCRHFGVCGGCTTQHLPESLALALKSAPHYQTLAQRYPQAVYHPPVSSPRDFAYRTKVELTFLRDQSANTTLGFHRRGSFDKGVDVGRCWLSPLPAELLADLRCWMNRHSLRGWDPYQQDGELRYLLYRHSSRGGQALAALVVTPQAPLGRSQREELVALFKSAGVNGAFLLIQSSPAGAVVPDEVEHLFGSETLQERLGSLKFELGWNSFFQVNPLAYERLLETMGSWRQTPAGGRLLDLFCGVGSIGLSLYRPGDRLLGVESVERAVHDARRNAERNGVPAQFEHRSAEQLQDLEADLLILDPPRVGCHPRLLSLLREKAPAKELFYVSCNPHRLAEELDDLEPRYRLTQAQAFDFFPQTHHCELLLHFQRR